MAADTEASLEDELAFLAAERQIVVTASKLEELVDKTVATTTVITQDDIRHIGARNLLDVLRIVPGIGITQSHLGIREIEVRGVKTLFSEKVLFMLNGHPLDHNLQNAGSTWVYDDLPVDTIKRVEVVRGPGSALYGANAFLAVINIITLGPEDLNGAQASAGWGSFDTQLYRASWGKRFDNTAEAAVQFIYADTNGIGSDVPADSLSLAGEDSLAPGKSQLTETRYDLEWQLGYQGFKLDGRFIHKRTGAFIGPAYALSDRTRQNYDDYFIRLSKIWSVTEDFDIETQVFHDRFHFDNVLQNAPTSFSRNATTDTRTGGELQGNYRISDTQILIAGFSYASESQYGLVDEAGSDPTELQPSLPFSKNRDRQRWGLYAQDVWDVLPNLRLTVGARYDEYNDFGGTFNPRMGFNWEFINNYSLKFSYGTAYRAPSFGELDLFNNDFLAGNPNLSPEEAETFEAGIIAKPVPGLSTQATYYHTHIGKVISQVPGETTTLRYENSGSILSEGVEVEGRYDFSEWFPGSYISANVVYQHTLQNGMRVPDVPETRANVLLNWAFHQQWSILTHVLVKGKTLRDVGDTRASVPSYALLDMTLLSRDLIGNNIDVSFSVYNLLDQHYVDPAPASIPGDYQQAERAYYGHVTLRF